MPTSTSGKSFTATVGSGPAVPIQGTVSADVQEVGDELDATDSESAPYISTDIGCTGLRTQIKGHFRVDGHPFPTFKVGTILTDVKIYPHGATEPEYTMAEAICLPGSVSIQRRGKVEYTLNIASRGTFTTPTP